MKFFCDNKRHLVCVPYTVANLHQMADTLNIKRCWFHAGDKAHYDIPKTRISEVQAKCEIVSPRRILEIIQSHHPV